MRPDIGAVGHRGRFLMTSIGHKEPTPMSVLCQPLKKMKKRLTIKPHSYIIGFAFEKNQASGCGSAWLECLIWVQEVAGSNPVTPIG